MNDFAKEFARIVGEALKDWPGTFRFCFLLVVATGAWTCYHLWTK
jgi:hypothetical protein